MNFGDGLLTQKTALGKRNEFRFADIQDKLILVIDSVQRDPVTDPKQCEILAGDRLL